MLLSIKIRLFMFSLDDEMGFISLVLSKLSSQHFFVEGLLVKPMGLVLTTYVVLRRINSADRVEFMVDSSMFTQSKIAGLDTLSKVSVGGDLLILDVICVPGGFTSTGDLFFADFSVKEGDSYAVGERLVLNLARDLSPGYDLWIEVPQSKMVLIEELEDITCDSVEFDVKELSVASFKTNRDNCEGENMLDDVVLYFTVLDSEARQLFDEMTVRVMMLDGLPHLRLTYSVAMLDVCRAILTFRVEVVVCKDGRSQMERARIYGSMEESNVVNYGGTVRICSLVKANTMLCVVQSNMSPGYWIVFQNAHGRIWSYVYFLFGSDSYLTSLGVNVNVIYKTNLLLLMMKQMEAVIIMAIHCRRAMLWTFPSWYVDRWDIDYDGPFLGMVGRWFIFYGGKGRIEIQMAVMPWMLTVIGAFRAAVSQECGMLSVANISTAAKHSMFGVMAPCHANEKFVELVWTSILHKDMFNRCLWHICVSNAGYGFHIIGRIIMSKMQEMCELLWLHLCMKVYVVEKEKVGVGFATVVKLGCRLVHRIWTLPCMDRTNGVLEATLGSWVLQEFTDDALHTDPCVLMMVTSDLRHGGRTVRMVAGSKPASSGYKGLLMMNRDDAVLIVTGVGWEATLSELYSWHSC